MTKDEISYLTNHLKDHKKRIKMDMEIYNYPSLVNVIELLDKTIKELEGEIK